MLSVALLGEPEISQVRRRKGANDSFINPERTTPGWVAFTVMPVFSRRRASANVNKRFAVLVAPKVLSELKFRSLCRSSKSNRVVDGAVMFKIWAEPFT